MKLCYVADKKEVTHQMKTGVLDRTCTIGRSVSCTIPLTEGLVSRTNSTIIHWDGEFVLRDSGSKNGTFLNGKKIEFAKLKAGDVIRIGDTDIRVEA